jgi:4-nitrophenyl phosphatase
MKKQQTINSLILDMDGVLWKGEQPIGDLPFIFKCIHQHKYKVVLATNNAMLSTEDYFNKLNRFGVCLERWQIINSSLATASYLRNKYPEGGPVFIIGENGLHNTLDKYGFFHSEDKPIAVVAGLDRSLTYEKLKIATLFIRNGADFIGTNPDRTYPMPEGLVPGAGSILAALESASDSPPKIIGKPAPEMYYIALNRLKSKPEETLVIGDRLETDIVGAQLIGCPTGLVLSGVTTREMAMEWEPTPTFITQDLADMLNVINE